MQVYFQFYYFILFNKKHLIYICGSFYLDISLEIQIDQITQHTYGKGLYCNKTNNAERVYTIIKLTSLSKTESFPLFPSVVGPSGTATSGYSVLRHSSFNLRRSLLEEVMLMNLQLYANSCPKTKSQN